MEKKITRSQYELTQLLTNRTSGSAAGRIVRTISARGALSAAEIAHETGLARSTVSTVLTGLRQSGITVETDARPGQPKAIGRPVTAITLNPDAGTCIGIHLGLREIDMAVIDVAHSIVSKKRIPLDLDYDPADAAERSWETAKKTYDENGLDLNGLLGVGISVSGPVSPDGCILHSSILPRWAGRNVRDTFEPVFGRPVTADNESNCAAVAEMTWGAARNDLDFILFKVDLGVGGAIVQNGSIIAGAAGGGGEFGHICVDPGGELCRCGNRGCLETLVSFNHPLEELSRLHRRDMKMDDAILLARAGDPVAKKLIDETGERAGWGLSFVGTILNPPLIIIAGRMALAGDLLMSPLIRAFERHVMIKSPGLPPQQRTRITTGDFTEDGSLRGAAGLVLRDPGEISNQKVQGRKIQ